MSASLRSSSSRRGNPLPSSTKTSIDGRSRAGSPKKAPPRRSRSVSAFPRTQSEVFSGEFSNRMDNPLFCDGIGAQKEVKVSKLRDSVGNGGGEIRGRSISRKGEIGGNGSGARKESGRSFSVVDTARRSRSVSRRPVSRGNLGVSEIGLEKDANLSRDLRKMNASSASSSVKKGTLSRSNSSLASQMEGLRSRSNWKHFGRVSRRDSSSSKSGHREDRVSTGSVSEAEQADNLVGGGAGIYETVRSEVRRAIYDVQNDLESVDTTREYADKLEQYFLLQSEERARKLRADLAVEEQLRIELSRILQEEVEDPKTSPLQKPRGGRKASMERRKISRTLTEDAMAYFDECVSLSTLDSTDFSSFEEPPIAIVGGTTLESDNCSDNFSLNINQEAYPSGNEQNGRYGRSQFSFSSLKPSKTSELQHDIRSILKSCERNTRRDETEPRSVTGSKEYGLDAYTPPKMQESLLLDYVCFKNRLESGSMLLCSGGDWNFIFTFC